jgi:hypothetical protein
MLAIAAVAARRHDLRTLGGLAAGVVPIAVLVHLLAELAAVAPGPGDAFVLRHAYLVPLMIGGSIAFARTLGYGCARNEFVRRSALTRAALRRVGAGAGIASLLAANLAFFAATQALEGVPIAAGSITLGLAVAALGSLVAAFVVFALGRTLVVAIVVALRRAAARALPVLHAAPVVRTTRRASHAFSLFVPNRPPPIRP